MVEKLRLCKELHDFSSQDPGDIAARDFKKKTLQDLVDHVSRLSSAVAPPG